MKNYKSEFLNVIYEPENSLLSDKWSDKTYLMTDDEFVKEITIWKDLIIESGVQFAIIDTSDFLYTISPEMQEWVDEYITKPTVLAGLVKMAFLVSKEIFAQVSIQQTMDENKISTLEVKYFTEEIDARQWFAKYQQLDTKSFG